ncbi:MAG: helix-turn-helix transcriptional regulator [bacterium]|nr:helix-turn-helix transcriptional regulator [bacterium]
MQKTGSFKSKQDVQYIVGCNVRKICKEKDVNLMEFSEEIDISYEYLRHIVSIGGKKSLSFYSMYKIAKILGITMDELCSGIFDDKNKLK